MRDVELGGTMRHIFFGDVEYGFDSVQMSHEEKTGAVAHLENLLVFRLVEKTDWVMTRSMDTNPCPDDAYSNLALLGHFAQIFSLSRPEVVTEMFNGN